MMQKYFALVVNTTDHYDNGKEKKLFKFLTEVFVLQVTLVC